MSQRNAFRGCAPVLALLFVLTASASAQGYTPKYEAGLSYSWLHVNSANYDYQRTGNGGSGYFEYNVNRSVGLAPLTGRRKMHSRPRRVADSTTG